MCNMVILQRMIGFVLVVRNTDKNDNTGICIYNPKPVYLGSLL